MVALNPRPFQPPRLLGDAEGVGDFVWDVEIERCVH